METEQIISEAGLRKRADSKRAVASAMVEDREHCREAWVAAGFAVEFSLKALIARRHGWTYWASKDARPDLHVHSIRSLLALAGIAPTDCPKGRRGSLKTVMDWERRHDYIETTMPRQVARSIVAATFGDDGIVPWLNSI